MPNDNAQALEHISSLNDNTRRAFDTLLNILESVAPGVRDNILWVLRADAKEKGRDLFHAGPNYSLEASFELPDPERRAAEVLAEQKSEVFRDGGYGFDLFPNDRRLRIDFQDPIAEGSSAAILTVHAGGNLADYHAIDKLAISFEDKKVDGTDAVRTDQVEGRNYLNQSSISTRLGRALTQTLRGRIEFLNITIKGVREKVASAAVES